MKALGMRVTCLVLMLGLAASAAPATAADEAPSSFAPLVEKAGPSVVNISAVKVVKGTKGG